MKKFTGMQRKLDPLGRICLPKEIRDAGDINEGDPMDIYIEDDVICLKPIPKKICANCERTEQLIKLEKIYLCKKCGSEVIDGFMED